MSSFCEFFFKFKSTGRKLDDEEDALEKTQMTLVPALNPSLDSCGMCSAVFPTRMVLFLGLHAKKTSGNTGGLSCFV